MQISDSINTRGIYIINDFEVCFDSYHYYTGPWGISQNYDLPMALFQHIKRRYESNV